MSVMRAMVLERPQTSLTLREQPIPQPAAGEILVDVSACGVCRTDLHVVDGELPHPKLPIVPGHEIVGRVAALGAGVSGFALGARVGVPWLGHTCGICPYCRDNKENLCDAPLFTGYTRDGGYATHSVADANYCFPLPECIGVAEAAPLLCAGLIGWRSYRMAVRQGPRPYGLAPPPISRRSRAQGRCVYAFTAAAIVAQDFPALGAVWLAPRKRSRHAARCRHHFRSVAALVPLAPRR